MARVPARRRPGADHRVAVPAGAHHPGDQVEGLEAVFVHAKKPVPAGGEIDLALPGRRRQGNTLTGHGPGEGQGGVIFVDPLGTHLVGLRHVKVVAPHLLQAAQVAHRDHLVFLEDRPLALPGDHLGQVVEHVPPTASSRGTAAREGAQSCPNSSGWSGSW